MAGSRQGVTIFWFCFVIVLMLHCFFFFNLFEVLQVERFFAGWHDHEWRICGASGGSGDKPAQLFYEAVSPSGVQVMVSATSMWQRNLVCCQSPDETTPGCTTSSQCHVLRNTSKMQWGILLVARRRCFADSEQRFYKLIHNCTRDWKSLQIVLVIGYELLSVVVMQVNNIYFGCLMNRTPTTLEVGTSSCSFPILLVHVLFIHSYTCWRELTFVR